MASFDVQITLRVRNILLNNETSGVRASIQSQLAEGEHYVEIAQTETVYDEVNVNFNHRCNVQYRFDRRQRMQVIVYGVRDESGVFSGSLGRAEFDLPSLVSKGKMSLPLPHSQSFIDITATVSETHSLAVRLGFSAAHLHSPSDLPLAAYLAVLLRTDNHCILLHKTEVIKENKYPSWKPFVLPLHPIQHYPEAALQIHCYNYNVNSQDTVIGYFSTTLAQLQHGIGTLNTYMLVNANGVRVDEKTSVQLTQIEPCRVDSFTDLCRNGLNVPVSVAVDLSASNGNPVQPTSLHYIHPHSVSAYEHAILRTVPPLLPFMAQPKIVALGFAAKVEPKYELSQCFSLGGSASPVDGVNGLLGAYRKARMEVQPFAPTEYSDVIYHVSTLAKAESRRRLGLYFVLLIFCDGGNFAPRRSIDAIVDASTHPISVVAVGIGEDRDFTMLQSLESPFLKHSDGRPLARQMFQFVKASQLADSDALALIPQQVAAWHAANPK